MKKGILVLQLLFFLTILFAQKDQEIKYGYLDYSPKSGENGAKISIGFKAGVIFSGGGPKVELIITSVNIRGYIQNGKEYTSEQIGYNMRSDLDYAYVSYDLTCNGELIDSEKKRSFNINDDRIIFETGLLTNELQCVKRNENCVFNFLNIDLVGHYNMVETRNAIERYENKLKVIHNLNNDFEKASQLLLSSDPEKWKEAQNLLKKIKISSYADDELKNKAENKITEAVKKTEAFNKKEEEKRAKQIAEKEAEQNNNTLTHEHNATPNSEKSTTNYNAYRSNQVNQVTPTISPSKQYTQKALSYYNVGNYTQAKEYAEKALREDAENNRARSILNNSNTMIQNDLTMKRNMARIENSRIQEVKMREAFNDISNMTNLYINSSFAQARHKERVDALTSLSVNTNNPTDLIAEYQQNYQQLKKAAQDDFERKYAQNKAYIETQKKYANTPGAQAGVEFADKMNPYLAYNSAEKEYKKNVRELKDNLKKEMNRIKDNYIKEHNNAAESYLDGAIRAFYESDENHYYKYYNYHTCISEYARSNFDYMSDEWVYHNCQKPQHYTFKGNPYAATSNELLSVARRKNTKAISWREQKFNNQAYSYVNKAINADPKNAEAYYFRSQFLDGYNKYYDVLRAYLIKPQNSQYKSTYENLSQIMASNLEQAIKRDDIIEVKKLTSNNIYYSYKHKLKTNPYYSCIENDQSALLTHFLNLETNKNQFISDNGLNLLFHAISKNSLKCISLLCDSGVSLNQKDKLGFTPLNLSLSYNNKKMTQLLLQKGANSETEYQTLKKQKNYLLSEKLVEAFIDQSVFNTTIQKVDYISSHSSYISQPKYQYMLATYVDTDNGKFLSEVSNDVYYAADEGYYLKTIEENTLESYQKYLHYFKNGKHIEDVNAEIAEIDKAHYLKAVKENNLDACRNYLHKFPDGIYTNKINELIDGFDEKYYQNALNKNEKTSYLTYRKEFPDGLHINKVNTKFEEYLIEQARTQKKLAIEKETVDRRTLLKNAINNYDEYLHYFPGGIFSQEAKKEKNYSESLLAQRKRKLDKFLNKDLVKKNYITWQPSLLTPISFQIGTYKYDGVYFSIHSRIAFKHAEWNTSVDGSVSDYSGDGYYIFTSESKQTALHFTMGGIYRIKPEHYITYGAGYAIQATFWYIDEYSYLNDELIDNHPIKVDEYSKNGALIETGYFFNKNRFIIGANGTYNIAVPSKSTLSIGLGLTF